MPCRNQHLPCEPVEPSAPHRTDESIRVPLIARLSIDGLQCRHCATRIRNALVSSPYVLGAEVCLETGLVDVLFDATRLTVDGLASVIRSAAEGSPRHYEVTGFETA